MRFFSKTGFLILQFQDTISRRWFQVESRMKTHFNRNFMQFTMVHVTPCPQFGTFCQKELSGKSSTTQLDRNIQDCNY